MQRARVLVEIALVAADDELPALRGREARLAVAVESRLRRLRLPRPLEGLGHDLALQHRGRGADDQQAGIAAHRVAALQPLLRADQRAVEVFGGVLAPARMRILEAPVDARVQ